MARFLISLVSGGVGSNPGANSHMLLVLSPFFIIEYSLEYAHYAHRTNWLFWIRLYRSMFFFSYSWHLNIRFFNGGDKKYKWTIFDCHVWLPEVKSPVLFLTPRMSRLMTTPCAASSSPSAPSLRSAAWRHGEFGSRASNIWPKRGVH